MKNIERILFALATAANDLKVDTRFFMLDVRGSTGSGFGMRLIFSLKNMATDVFNDGVRACRAKEALAQEAHAEADAYLDYALDQVLLHPTSDNYQLFAAAQGQADTALENYHGLVRSNATMNTFLMLEKTIRSVVDHLVDALIFEAQGQPGSRERISHAAMVVADHVCFFNPGLDKTEVWGWLLG